MKLKPDQVPTAWRGLEGWIAQVLSSEKRGKARCVVEIGTDWGFSFWHLLTLFPFAEVYSVDPYGVHAEAWAGKDGAEAERAVKSWADKHRRAVMVKQESLDAAMTWKHSIDFLHIDGRHDLASVTADFNAWEPHVKVGGLVAFHDTVSHAETVGRLVSDLKISMRIGKMVAETEDFYGMAIWRKDA